MAWWDGKLRGPEDKGLEASHATGPFGQDRSSSQCRRASFRWLMRTAKLENQVS